MMRGTATLLSAVVVVFSLTFVGARLSAAPAPAAPQLAAAPTVTAAPLTVQTLRAVAPLPRLQLPGGAAAGVAAAPLPAPVPAPQAVSPARPSGERLCARAAWLLPTGGAPALPRTGRC